MDLDSKQMMIEDDGCPWYAVRLFSLKQKEVADTFVEKGLTYFVPMQYVDYLDRENKRRTKLAPVVHNLIFVKATMGQRAFRLLVSEIPYKMMVLKKIDSSDFYEIPSKQMHEFCVMCNPDLLMNEYLSEEEAKLKKGTRVLVTHGPLKGLTGKLVRQSKKYYLLKEVPGMAVMIKVTRWCCKAEEN